MSIRDPQCVAAVISLLDQTTLAPATFRKPERSHFGVIVPPAGVKSYSATPYPIWRYRPGEFIWSDGENDWKLAGDVDALIHSFRAHRIGQLITSRSSARRREGLELREMYSEQVRPDVLKLLRSPNEYLSRFAIRILTNFDAEVEFNESLGLSSKRLSKNAATELVELMRDTLPVLQRNPLDSSAINVWGDVCRQLASSGRIEVAGSLADFLPETPDGAHGRVIDTLMDAIEGLHGLPPSYKALFICGNSTPNELRLAATAQKKRRIEGRERLLKWLQKHGDGTREECLTAVIELWRPALQRLAKDAHTLQSYSYDRPDKALKRLLTVGPDLAPVARKQIVQEHNLNDRGMLEYLATAVTADCNSQLVDELLAGDNHQKIIACQIIAEADKVERERWVAQLTSFLQTPLHQTERQEKLDKAAFVLRESATEALFKCRGVKILPLLEATSRDQYDNRAAQQLISRYLIPEFSASE